METAGDICSKIVDGDHNPPKGIEEKTQYLMLSSRNINDGTLVDLSNVRYLTRETFEIEDQRTKARKGDILFTSVGSLGRSCVFDGSINVCFQRSVSVLTTSEYNYYIKYFFDSPYFQFKVKTEATGTAQKGFYLNQLEASPIPLPPLAEQKRIVAKIEELMPLVEEYGKAETELAALNDNFPTALRKSILQHAVEGRLTATWRNTGRARTPAAPFETAADLLAKIAAEKKSLLAAGKIKKSKPLPPITEDEKPFPIPETWAWVRLGEISSKIGAGSTPKGGANVYVSHGVKLLREQNIHDDGLHLDNVVYITKETNDAKPGSQVQPKDILVNITGASIGRNSLVPDDFDTANVNQHVLIVRLIERELRFYIHESLRSPLMLNLMYGKQTGDKPGLSAEKVMAFPIPLPPLAEQKAIVARVEELLSLVEEMKE